jgi:hypothetical protein
MGQHTIMPEWQQQEVFFAGKATAHGVNLDKIVDTTSRL